MASLLYSSNKSIINAHIDNNSTTSSSIALKFSGKGLLNTSNSLNNYDQFGIGFQLLSNTSNYKELAIIDASNHFINSNYPSLRIGITEPYITIKTQTSNNNYKSLLINSNITITSNAIGIGTNSPNSSLDIRGDLTLSGIIRKLDGSALTASQWSNSSITPNSIYYNQGFVGIGTTNPISSLDIRGNLTIEGILNRPLGLIIQSNQWTLNNNLNKIISYNQGFIGIGTTIPQSILHIHSNTSNVNTMIQITNSNLNNFYIGLNSNNDGFIVNSNNSNFIIGTLNQERIRITSNGRVGIGTTNPRSILDVRNDIIIDGQIMRPNGTIIRNIWSNSSITPNSIYYNQGFVGIGTTSPNSSLDIREGDLTIGGILKRPLGSIIQSNQWTLNNNPNKIISYNQGFIGIGTINPQSILHIHSNTSNVNTMIQISNSNLSNLFIELNSNNDGFLINSNNSNFIIGTLNQERLRITSNGLIGIGTTNPRSILDLNDNLTFVGKLLKPDNSLYISSNQWSNSVIISSNIYYNLSNVGIGTTNPSSLIHLQGNNLNGTLMKISGINNGLSIGLTNKQDGLILHNDNSSLIIGTSNQERLRIFNYITRQIVSSSTCNITLDIPGNAIYNYTNNYSLLNGSYIVNYIQSNSSLRVLNRTNNIIINNDKSYPIIKDSNLNDINPSLWYKFDDNLNIGLDSSGNNYNLTCNINNAILNLNGLRGNSSLYLNSSSTQSLRTEVNQGLNLDNSSFSICFWVNLINKTPTNGMGVYSRFHNSIGTDEGLFIGFYTNSFIFGFTSDDLSLSINDYSSFNNNWNFIVCIFNNTTKTQSIYINGSFSTSRTTTGNTTLTSPQGRDQTYIIGTNYTAGANFYNGYLDDFRIYKNLVLTQNQINELYYGRIEFYQNFGNIGIGITNPTNQLSIVGNVNIRSNLFINNYLITSNQLLNSNYLNYSNNELNISNYNYSNTLLPTASTSLIAINNTNGYYQFINSTSTTLTSHSITFTNPTYTDLLLVGAGGNGGTGSSSGGGGAGEVIYYPSFLFQPGLFNIIVGRSSTTFANRTSKITLGSQDIITATGGGDGGYLLSLYSTSGSGTVSSITSIASTNDAYLSFTDGTTTLTLNSSITCDILAVGGGGGGCTGGGGAGQVVYQPNQTLNAGNYTITVGAGGAGVAPNSIMTAANRGNDGNDSFIQLGGIDVVRAYKGGGGAGNTQLATAPTGIYGSTGGNGINSGGSENTFTAGTVLGFVGGVGGNTSSYNSAGGGGGAGEKGQPGTSGPNDTLGSGAIAGRGGNGVQNSITGTSIYYGGGGGGGTNINNTTGNTILNRPAGGLGGGGEGSRLANESGLSAAANTGGGGGGSDWEATNAGNNGGSGIVIIRFKNYSAGSSVAATSGGSGGGGTTNQSGALAGLPNSFNSYLTSGNSGTASSGGNGGSASGSTRFTTTITGSSLTVGGGGTGVSGTPVAVNGTNYGDGGSGNGGVGNQGIVIIKINTILNKHLQIQNDFIEANNVIIEPNSFIYKNSDFSIIDKYWNNSNIAINYSQGNVGIGILRPLYKLDVNGDINISGKLKLAGNDLTTSTLTFSDSRIKTNINDIYDNEALNQINRIEPKTFNYIDTIENTSNNIYGFIAQQIKPIIPHAIKIDTEFIPNIYKTFNCEGNQITTEEDLTEILKIGSIIKIRETKEKTAYISATVLFISSGMIIIDKYLSSSSCFIYGIKVEDFHLIDKSYIYTISVCATQDLYRKIRELNNRYEEQQLKLKQIREYLGIITEV